MEFQYVSRSVLLSTLKDRAYLMIIKMRVLSAHGKKSSYAYKGTLVRYLRNRLLQEDVRDGKDIPNRVVAQIFGKGVRLWD